MKKLSVLLFFILLVPAIITVSRAEETPAGSQAIVFGANHDESTYVGKLAWLVYTEAFKRLKMPFKIRIFPLKRLEMSTRAGLVDGDIARTALWGEGRDDLIRIKEPIMYLNFSLYSADPAVVINRPSDISEKKLTIKYPRGMKVCEKFAKEILPQKQVDDVTTTEDGVRKILVRNIYLLCDLDANVDTFLHSSVLKERDASKIKRVFYLESKVPIYPYLLKKHVQLAQKLTRVLKQMRTEGLLDKYQKQVDREFSRK